MCKKLFRISLLALIVLLGALPFPTARGTQTADVTLTVRQQLEGVDAQSSSGDSFTYLLAPKSPCAPMPQGGSAKGYRFEMSGSGRLSIGPIRFSGGGVYSYTLSHVTEARSGITADRQIYTVDVYVTADLSAATAIYSSGDGKVPELLFTHSYHNTSTSTPTPPTAGPQTGDDANPTGWILLIAGSVAMFSGLWWLVWNKKEYIR